MRELASGRLIKQGALHYHYDGLGSVIALSDSAGRTVEMYEYDVYGSTIIRAPTQEPPDTSLYGNPYMFTGRRFDTETRLYYYRARYYSTEIGRFLQTDPIGYADSMNLYTYVGNNPIVLIDPFGLCAESAWYSPKAIFRELKNPRLEIWQATKYYANNALRTLSYKAEKAAPDAITISLSGAGFTPKIIGGGGGVEAVYIFGQGWVIYGQGGGGGGVPGGGGALEIGPIWNLKKPEHYTGLFTEGQGGVMPVSGSIFYSPTGGVWGFKAGPYGGTPGGGAMGEGYFILKDFTGNN